MTAEGDRSTDEAAPGAGQASGAPERERGIEKKLPRLSLGMRIVAFALGWGLVLIGVVGLVLPGIQGILTLLLGTAVLSVASETVYRLLRRVFSRWPGGWKRVRSFRRKVHGWLHRSDSSDRSDG